MYFFDKLFNGHEGINVNQDTNTNFISIFLHIYLYICHYSLSKVSNILHMSLSEALHCSRQLRLIHLTTQPPTSHPINHQIWDHGCQMWQSPISLMAYIMPSWSPPVFLPEPKIIHVRALHHYVAHSHIYFPTKYCL